MISKKRNTEDYGWKCSITKNSPGGGCAGAPME